MKSKKYLFLIVFLFCSAFLTSGFRIMELEKVLPDYESISLPGIVVNTFIIVSNRYMQVDITELNSIIKKIEFFTDYYKINDYKIKLYAVKGSYNLITGNDYSGLKLLYEAKKLANISGNTNLLSRICISIGFYFLNNGEYYRAMTEFE